MSRSSGPIAGAAGSTSGSRTTIGSSASRLGESFSTGSVFNLRGLPRRLEGQWTERVRRRYCFCGSVMTISVSLPQNWPSWKRLFTWCSTWNALAILKAELQNSINHFKLNLQGEKGPPRQMAFIFGKEAFEAGISHTAPSEPSGSTDSVSLESVDPNGEEWDMWETLKALRVQTKRRGLRAAKYRRAATRACQGQNELQMRYLSALERTEALARTLTALEEVKVRQASRERQPLPKLDKDATCVICLCNPRGVAFVPCGHIACCQQCADQIARHARGRDFPRCPICRAEFSKAQPLYYA